jgi:hypothetical protein
VQPIRVESDAVSIGMALSERVYFLAEPAAHVVARNERLRLQRIMQQCRQLHRAKVRGRASL